MKKAAAGKTILDDLKREFAQESILKTRVYGKNDFA